MKNLCAIIMLFFLPLVPLNAQTTCYSKEVEQLAGLYSVQLGQGYLQHEVKYIYVTQKEPATASFSISDSGEYIFLIVTEKAASIVSAEVFAGEKIVSATEKRPEKNVIKIELEKPVTEDCSIRVKVERNSGFDSCTGIYLFRKR